MGAFERAWPVLLGPDAEDTRGPSGAQAASPGHTQPWKSFFISPAVILLLFIFAKTDG